MKRKLDPAKEREFNRVMKEEGKFDRALTRSKKKQCPKTLDEARCLLLDCLDSNKKVNMIVLSGIGDFLKNDHTEVKVNAAGDMKSWSEMYSIFRESWIKTAAK